MYIDLLRSTRGSEIAMTIREGINEMRQNMANTTLNLYRGGLQEAREAKRLEVVLVKDEITYHGSVGDVYPSMSILGPSKSFLGPSTSILVHP
jgi:hypothetical protein